MIRNLIEFGRELLNAALVAVCPCGEECSAPRADVPTVRLAGLVPLSRERLDGGAA